jgi:hypothetical protein
LGGFTRTVSNAVNDVPVGAIQIPDRRHVGCALEDDDAGEFRLSKIERIIEECKFGIHDLSAVALDVATGLPRFNMPLELGLFLGC